MELTSIQIGWLMLGLAVGLLLLGLPVAVTMIIAGVLGTFLIRGWDPSLISLAYITWRQSLNQILVIIPLFMWMGTLAARGGIGEASFKSLYNWVGQFRGGLTMAVAIATAAFSAISGNHIACAAAMSKVSFPELRRYKYDDGFSLATIAASANLDIMIPPSGAFILYGFLTDTSIPSLFVAGILPGAFIMVLLLIQIAVQCRINPSLGPAAPRVGWIDRLKSTYLLLPIVFIFGVVMGGLYFGIFTPIEAASWGVFLVLVISIATRKLSVKAFIESLRDALPTSAMIMLMLIGGYILSNALALSGLPDSITSFIVGSGLSKYAVMALIMVIYLIAGMLTDIYPVMIITLPIFFPIVTALGFDPYHFGVLCVVAIMAGSISPPFAILAFTLHGLWKVPLDKIFRASVPFLITTIVSMFIIMFWPQLVTFLVYRSG